MRQPSSTKRLRSSRSALAVLCLLASACSDRGASCSPPRAEPARSESDAVPAPQSSAASPTCDLERLDAAARQLAEAHAQWSPRTGQLDDRSAVAAGAVWVACGESLGPKRRALLDALVPHPIPDHVRQGMPAPADPPDPLAATLPGHQALHEGPLAAGSWTSDSTLTAAVCPEFDTVARGLAEVPRDQRAGKLWDACKLDDTAGAYLSRAEFEATQMPPVAIPLLALGRWLEAQGLEPASARPIVRELLRRAVDSGRPVTLGHLALIDQIRLPAIDAGEPLEDGIPIAIGPDAIEGFGHLIRLGDASAGLDAASAQLLDRLAEEAEQARMMSRHSGSEWEGSILLIADRDTPWESVLRILANAESAGVAHGRLVALTDQHLSPLRTVLVHAPGRPARDLAVPDQGTVANAIDIATSVAPAEH